jgi:dimethylargininase
LFSKAIVRIPCKKIIFGLSSANLGKPNYGLALKQHEKYMNALQSCGLKLLILEPDEGRPDSTFVEDTALLTPKCAIILRPAPLSRRSEIDEIKAVLKNNYTHIEEIKSPGTAEGGDVLKVGNHYYIGLSQRTNLEGINQLIDILKKYGYTASTIKLKNILHLKSNVAFLKPNSLVVAGELIKEPQFNKFQLLKINDQEIYAANCIGVNGKVLIAKNYFKTKELIESHGYFTIECDMSEFQKLDGGLSCLSLRF